MTKKLITRRLFLFGTAVTITAVCLPAIFSSENNILKVTQGGQFFTAHELTLLSDIAEIMIPRTDTPGAIDAHVPTVIDGLMVTWAGNQTKRWFKEILTYFEKISNEKYNQSYEDVSLGKRYTLIEQYDLAAFSDKPPQYSEAYKHLKYIIFRSFYTSQEANQALVPVPGFYHGNLTLDEYNAYMKERAHG